MWCGVSKEWIEIGNPSSTGDRSHDEPSAAEKHRRDEPSAWASALRHSALGIEFGLGAWIGYASGAWLDKRFGTEPYLAILLLLLGLAAAFRSLFRLLTEKK